jgi:2-dehydro-3-deoxyphosphogluconate aldolase/(4S)-4-hydroxy-2-oxoglutarate aldolase
MTTRFSQDLFEQLPIVGILRGFPENILESVIQSVLAGGLANLEITMNSPAAAAQIRHAIACGGTRLNTGAGTVTNRKLLTDALDAGAGFIVTPTVATEVIRECVALGVPVFPGAFSPSEIMTAWDLGATMVKVFPADQLGPSYLRSLKAPLPGVRLMPTGGVDLTNLREFKLAGADAFGIGSPLFQPDRIAAADWTWLTNRCRAFAEQFRGGPL